MSQDADQFLGLIAENAQIKAEIGAIRQFSSAIRLFNEGMIRESFRQVKCSQRPREDLSAVVSKIRMGIPSVESAESFKQRMVAERTKKLGDAQRVKIAELDEKIAQSESKRHEISETLESIRARVDDHRRILSELQAIRDNFAKQIELLRNAVNSMSERKTAIAQEVSRAQAAGLEMRRSIEQAHRECSEFTENGTRESKELASIRKIVGDLRAQMKKKATG